MIHGGVWRVGGYQVLGALLISVYCTSGGGAPNGEPSVSQLPRGAKYPVPTRLQTFVGEGYEMTIPADARVTKQPLVPEEPQLDTVTRIEGRDLRGVDAFEQNARWGPIYALTVRTLENREHVALEVWVRKQCEEYVESYGVTIAELERTSPTFRGPAEAIVGGQKVWWYMPVCADCRMFRVYFGKDKRIVEIAFDLEAIGFEDPLEPLQQILYAFVLDSFQWR